MRYGQNKFLQPFCFLFQRFLVSNATWETADVKNVFSSPKIGGVAQNSCQNGQMDGEIWQKQAIGDGHGRTRTDTRQSGHVRGSPIVILPGIPRLLPAVKMCLLPPLYTGSSEPSPQVCLCLHADTIIIDQQHIGLGVKAAERCVYQGSEGGP